MASVAQSQIQDAVHPLLRHPRPLKRDPAKAQRMLSLITDSEAKALQRERSKTTIWLERPMYEHLEASPLGLEHAEEHIELAKVDNHSTQQREETDSELLDRWTKPDPPTLLKSVEVAQAQPEANPNTYASIRRKPLPQEQQSLRPTTNTQLRRPVSFQSDNSNFHQDSLSSSDNSRPTMRLIHNQTWDASSQMKTNARPVSLQPLRPSSGRDSLSPFGNLQPAERRPRPMSLATVNFRDRPNGKIASSRGLRNNSYPVFSKSETEFAPRVVPGEQIETHTTAHQTVGDEVASPSFPSPLRAPTDIFAAVEEKAKADKKSKKRWSSIPNTFKNMARRKFSISVEDPKNVVDLDNLHQMNAPEDRSNHHHEEIDSPTRNLNLHGLKHLPTPNQSPIKTAHPRFEAPLPPPFAPWTDEPPTPPSSLHQRKSSGLSISITMAPSQPQSPVTMPTQSRPASLHSQRSSGISPLFTSNATLSHFTSDTPTSPRVGMSRRGTPSLEKTCIICKTTKPHAEFMNRRITANCWHEPSTCLQCLESWVENCIVTKGWERCSCPECGENMASEDVGAFTSDSAFYSGK
ncbi:hypothetical protein P153DRAFT_382530 [Dothidotthia symphoricarpi CBS 119687]|uniref:RING-type domain-containing protein n=1 Tax=Dothidotthia symphoricarpi CBS 119687 TaxID=1392245 RepID=A0A6A6ALU3_9PLEO|nr:uncharacterized protein P153DRAFT_382530 [Dothidotthia symphoricarpi CBS 119687]KAF2132909.1 hypothetical protein P153DRAFT_382530 [Dothidotthia symphoricarpi CBS 119687]